MNIEFNSEKLAKRLSSEDELVKAYGLKARKIWSRLVILKIVKNFQVLQSIEVLNCRQGAASPTGHWLLTVSPNYSMIFLLDHSPLPMKEDGLLNSMLITRIKIIAFVPY
jgi:hypothetical protein